MKDRLGAAWFGPVRVVLLVVVALAALTNVTTYAALRAGDDRAETAEPAGPDEVARAVTQAVADEDCDDIGDLVVTDVRSPTITACLDDVERTVALTDVEVLDTATDGDRSVVTIGLAADGVPAEIEVVLRRDADRWVVVEMRPADG